MLHHSVSLPHGPLQHSGGANLLRVEPVDKSSSIFSMAFRMISIFEVAQELVVADFPILVFIQLGNDAIDSVIRHGVTEDLLEVLLADEARAVYVKASESRLQQPIVKLDARRTHSSEKLAIVYLLVLRTIQGVENLQNGLVGDVKTVMEHVPHFRNGY